jgi:type IV pilus assembly protein PilN
VGAALGVNCLVFGALLYLNNVNTNLEEDLAEKNAQLSKLNAEVKQIDEIKAKAKTFKEEADALATVFNDIKPWSALLGELASVLPSGVKIDRIEQKEEQGKAAPAAKGKEAPPAPKATTTLSLSGTANSYGEVNDFLLLIERSPFFLEGNTKLLSATKKANPARLELRSSQSGLAPNLPDLPQVVEYRIETTLSGRGASELLPQLKERGAIGLVDRIETLKEKGVI